MIVSEKSRPRRIFCLASFSGGATEKGRSNRFESGFALPSILLLILVISLIGVLSIRIVSFRKQVTLRELAKFKAELAAQSAVAEALATLDEKESLSFSSQLRKETFSGGEQGTVDLSVDSWGAFLRVRSSAIVGAVRKERVALVGGQTQDLIPQALIFANSDHELVFTGSARVRGDITVNRRGISFDNRSQTTIGSTFVDGKIERTESPQLPGFENLLLREEIGRFDDLLVKGSPSSSRSVSILKGDEHMPMEICGDAVPDSSDLLTISGDAVLRGSLVRRARPLIIVVRGNVTIAGSAELKGLVAVVADKHIRILRGASTLHAILYSKMKIEQEAGSEITAQLIAPRIIIEEGARTMYPSVVVSYSSTIVQDPDASVTLKKMARVEGSVLCIGSRAETKNPSLVIESGATVVGLVYCRGIITLEGRVFGSVFASDFYFFESPTSYFGWIRNGIIDRTALPSRFLAPLGFSQRTQLNVLDWL